MADDGMDVGRLGLEVDNAPAVQSLDAFGAATERAATRAEASSSRIQSTTFRNAEAVEGLNAAQQAYQARIDALTAATQNLTSADARTIATLEQEATAMRLLGDIMGSTTAQTEQLSAATSALAASTETASVAQATLAETSGVRVVGGFSRLSYSFGALDARMLGTSSIVGRMGSVFGNLFVGGFWTVGIMAGIALIVGAWKLLGDGADEVAKKVTESFKRMHDASLDARMATGDDEVKAAKKDLDAANAKLRSAEAGTSRTDPGTFATVRSVDIVAVQKARAAVSAAEEEYNGSLSKQKAYGAETKIESERQFTDRLALEIRTHHAVAGERDQALAQYRAQQKEIDQLGASGTDNVRRDQLISMNETLGSALFPKNAGVKEVRDQAAEVRTIISNLKTMGTQGDSDFSPLGKALDEEQRLISQTGGTKAAIAERANEYRALVAAVKDVSNIKIPEPDTSRAKSALQAADKSLDETRTALFKKSLSTVVPDIRNDDAFGNAIEAAKRQQDKEAIDNADRVAKGGKARGPSQDLKDMRVVAADAAKALQEGMSKAHMSTQAQHDMLQKIIADLREIGAIGPKAGDGMSMTEKVTSTMRSAADAANLIGGKRGAEWSNILNTGANAVTNVSAAVAEGGMNPLADAQAALSVVSLGKSILGLGGQSHDAKRGIDEATEALKMNLSVTNDSLSHNTLQGLLDQDRIAYDQLYKSINDTLPGLKNQTQREKDLAIATADYNQMLAQTQQNYALQQKDFNMSLTARMDAAHGLTYDAALINLQIQQQDEMAAAIQNGATQAQQAALAQVQLAEKTALANNAITQLANAPTGFFAERYFGPYAIPGGGSGTTTAPSQTTFGTLDGSSGFQGPLTIHSLTIPVSGAGDPMAVATAVVKTIRQVGNSIGGTGASISDTMDRMAV